MRTVIIGVGLSILGAWSEGLAATKSIGIFFDPVGAQCSGQLGPEPMKPLYVLALTAREGLSAAEFRIAGIPGGWTESNAIWQSGPRVAFTLGNPLFPRPFADGTRTGVAVTFAGCEADGVPLHDVGPVLLGTLNLLFAPTPNDVVLHIESANPPFGGGQPCPAFIDCAFPSPARVCVGGGTAFVNNTGPDCNLAVQPATWSRIRRLFR